jgi:hypothetical protein
MMQISRSVEKRAKDIHDGFAAERTGRALRQQLEHLILTLSIYGRQAIHSFVFCDFYHSWERGSNENLNGSVPTVVEKEVGVVSG